MSERGFVIVRFVFIFVRADSLQYLKNYYARAWHCNCLVRVYFSSCR